MKMPLLFEANNKRHFLLEAYSLDWQSVEKYKSILENECQISGDNISVLLPALETWPFNHNSSAGDPFSENGRNVIIITVTPFLDKYCPALRDKLPNAIRVIPLWIDHCLKMGKLLDYSFYEPGKLMSGVVAYLDGDERSEIENCRNLLLAAGGQVTSDQSCPVLSHFVSTRYDDNDEEDKSESLPAKVDGVHYVKTAWLKDSVTFKRKFYERDYCIGEDDEVPSDSSANLFKDCKFFLAEIEYAEEEMVVFTSNILDNGGQILEEFDPSIVTHVIVSTQDNEFVKDTIACMKQKKEGIKFKFVTLFWLGRCLESNKLVYPDLNVLCYPRPHKKLEGFKEFCMSVSNYKGDGREKIKTMLSVMGSDYTGILTPSNTHLISGSASGAKFEKAVSWNLKVCNHLWLEDCFQQWKAIDAYSNPNYRKFPIGLANCVGEVPVERVIFLDEIERETSSSVLSGNKTATSLSSGNVNIVEETDSESSHETDAGTEGLKKIDQAKEEIAEKSQAEPKKLFNFDNDYKLFDDTPSTQQKPLEGGDFMETDTFIAATQRSSAPIVAAVKAKRSRMILSDDDEESEAEANIKVDISEAKENEEPKTRTLEVTEEEKVNNEMKEEEVDNEVKEEQVNNANADTKGEPEEDPVVDPPKRNARKKAKTEEEAKPKRKPRAAAASKSLKEDAQSNVGSEELAAEDEPKPKRKPRAAAASKSLKEDGDSHVGSEELAAEDEPKPKRKPRAAAVSKTLKEDGDSNVGSEGLAAEDEPKPKRRSRAAASRSLKEDPISNCESEELAAPSTPPPPSKPKGFVDSILNLSTPVKATNPPALLKTRKSAATATASTSTPTGKAVPEIKVVLEKGQEKKDETPSSPPRKRTGARAAAASSLSMTDTPKRKTPVQRKKRSTAAIADSESNVSRDKEDDEGGNEDESASIVAESSQVSGSVRKHGSKVKIMFTVVKPSDDDEMDLKRMGALISSNKIDGCTHLITNKISRTEKFLNSVSLGLEIVTMEWIQYSILGSKFIEDTTRFRLKDVETEKRFGFTLEDSLKRARERKLLAGFSVFVTPSTKPEPSVMERIVVHAGGKFLKVAMSKISTFGEDPSKLLIISCAEDKKHWKSLADKASGPIAIYSNELILTGILQQRLDPSNEAYQLATFNK